MAYLVIHAVQHGRPSDRENVLGEPILDQQSYQPGDIFEPQVGDDVPALLASGVIAQDNEEGRARLAARNAALERINRPYGLL